MLYAFRTVAEDNFGFVFRTRYSSALHYIKYDTMFNTITVKIFPSPFIYIHPLNLYYHQVKVTSFAHRQLNTVKTKQSKFKRKLLCKSLNP